METTKKFYKFLDPLTGAQTKDIGWVSTSNSSKSKIIKGETGFTLASQEVVPITSNFKPQEKDAVEITEDDFNKLDTSGESLTYKLRREKKQLYFLKRSNTNTMERDFTQVVANLNAKLARA